MNPLHELQDTLLADRESGLSYTEIAQNHHMTPEEVRKLVVGAQRRRSHKRAMELKTTAKIVPQAHEIRPEKPAERANRLTGEMCDRAERNFA